MNRDPLEELLRDADDADGDAPRPPDAALASRVRRLAARRARRARLAMGGVVIGSLAAVAVWIVRPELEQPAPPVVAKTTQPSPKAAPDARETLLALAHEADRAAALAERMWAAERRSDHRTRRRSTAVATDVSAQVERAAFTMVYQAARMPATGGAASPAADVYRHVSRVFPDTPSAQVARQRLNELQTGKEG